MGAMAILHPSPNRPAPLPTARLVDALNEARRRARALGVPVLVSRSERIPAIDPLAVFAGSAGRGLRRVFWEHRDRETGRRLALAGIGAAATLANNLDNPFASAAAEWRSLLSTALLDVPASIRGVGPLALGGFRFDPRAPHTALWDGFSDCSLALPVLTITAVDGEHWLTTSLLVDPESDPDRLAADTHALRDRVLQAAAVVPSLPGGQSPQPRPACPHDVLPETEWCRLVDEAARDVRQGNLAKVVLAREVALNCPRYAFDPADALARLRLTFPDAYLFAVAPGRTECSSGEPVFLGASPERLVRLAGGILDTSCLAGSIGRGSTAEEDRTLGAHLLASAKDRVEHALVATLLREQLGPLCDTLEIGETPELARLANVQHLHTPVHGTLAARPGGTWPCILDLVARLHPTPAVGGYPRPEALELIRRRERLDRGWYAGPIGWLDRQGEGEFAVAIRSALLRESEAHLFAGCGIVGDSDSRSEYQESRLKLRAMLGALTGPG
ncbi:MAG TPA: isochorismate synthase [Chloroflexota bacterium]|nr:isochorismate synthase [Chloroflexota bacterium]